MTLHAMAETIKKFLKIVAIVAAAGFSMYLVVQIGFFVKNTLFPPPPDLPDAKYGKLPQIPFGTSHITETFTYSLDTLTGELPSLSDRAKVYKIINTPPTLTNSDRAIRKAEAIEFVDSENQPIKHIPLSPTLFRWEGTNKGLKRTLTMDIETFNFNLRSQYLALPSVINTTSIVNETEAESRAEELLSQMELYPQDIDKELTKTELLTIRNGTLIQATSLSTTQIVRVDLFQKALDEIPVYYPRHPNSMINFYITAKASDIVDVVEASYTYQKIDTTDSAQYSIKTAQEAFQELQDGKGYISNYNGTTPDIKISDVSLGYFISQKKQDYLLPVFVFQAEGDFYAFISAIKAEWIEEETITEQ